MTEKIGQLLSTIDHVIDNLQGRKVPTKTSDADDLQQIKVLLRAILDKVVCMDRYIRRTHDRRRSDVYETEKEETKMKEIADGIPNCS